MNDDDVFMASGASTAAGATTAGAATAAGAAAGAATNDVGEGDEEESEEEDEDEAEVPVPEPVVKNPGLVPSAVAAVQSEAAITVAPRGRRTAPKK